MLRPQRARAWEPEGAIRSKEWAHTSGLPKEPVLISDWRQIGGATGVSDELKVDRLFTATINVSVAVNVDAECRPGHQICG